MSSEAHGLKHGVHYTQVTYTYPESRVSAADPFVTETFTFEQGKGEFRPGLGSQPDTLRRGISEVTIQPGWLYRAIVSGVFNQASMRFEPSNLVAFPSAAPTPGPEGQP